MQNIALGLCQYQNDNIFKALRDKMFRSGTWRMPGFWGVSDCCMWRFTSCNLAVSHGYQPTRMISGIATKWITIAHIHVKLVIFCWYLTCLTIDFDWDWDQISHKHGIIGARLKVKHPGLSKAAPIPCRNYGEGKAGCPGEASFIYADAVVYRFRTEQLRKLGNVICPLWKD